MTAHHKSGVSNFSVKFLLMLLTLLFYCKKIEIPDHKDSQFRLKELLLMHMNC